MNSKKWSILILSIVLVVVFVMIQSNKPVDNSISVTSRTKLAVTESDFVIRSGNATDKIVSYSSIQELAAHSPYIVRATITSLKTEGMINGLATIVELRIDEVYKGALKKQQLIPFAFRGGVLNGAALNTYIESMDAKKKAGFLIKDQLPARIIHYMRENKVYNSGDEVLLFLKDKPVDYDSPYPYFLVAGEEGHFKIENGTIELHEELSPTNIMSLLTGDQQSMDLSKVIELIS